MKRRILCWLTTALLCGLWNGSVIAQEASDLPKVKTLSCGKDCPGATDPQVLGEHRASYPGFFPEDYPTEGLVMLRATVTKEGGLKDQTVVRVVGAKIFAEKALEATKVGVTSQRRGTAFQ